MEFFFLFGSHNKTGQYLSIDQIHEILKIYRWKTMEFLPLFWKT
jgi:hypothetical protein